MNNVLKRVYTAKQMNCGEGMKFHPATGERLARLRFYRSRGAFAHVLHPWWDDPIVLQYRRQISERKKRYAYGDPYPCHWRFDPWTGERLM